MKNPLHSLNRLMIAALLLKLRIFLLGQKVWLRETLYHSSVRHMHRMGVLAFAVDPEDEDFKSAVAAAVAEATSKLEAKNRELLTDLRKAKAKGGDVDPAELERLQGQVDDLNAQLTAANKNVKTLTTRAEAAEKSLSTEQAATQRMLVEQGLTSALTEAGVTNPVMLKAAAALLRGEKIEIAVDGENRVAKIGDKLLGDHVKAWAAGDEGKAFVSAPGNGGGGSTGSHGKTGPANPWAKETRNLTEQGRLYQENPTLAKSLAAEAGVTLP